MSAFLTVAARAFLTKTFFVWLARFFAKQSDNLVDDSVVDVIDAATKGDPIAMLEAGQRLIEEATKEAKKRELI